ncbi:NADH-quinone oxidoreductase subunit I [Opitutus sp. ER46]|uniref:NuoI/complex I 23 kDa subunit family protein n=1 Tax=Opitutus sp. ER46 TaxID=2161864 RepID=UPI0018EEABF5|nr:NADH-quinone oxidoreductase subunit I [Opitutus sp. ER46]
MSLIKAVRDTLSGFKSLLIGMRITGREALKPVITCQYPHDTLPMPARFRGHIQLVLDPETGRPRCTACTLCAKACPSNCIDLDGLKREGDKKKSVSKYILDFTKCSLCGSCVEVCPSDAIDFSKQYNVVSLSRGDFDHMDLYAKVEAQAAEWAKTHPTPPAPPAEAPAAPAAAQPAAPAASTLPPTAPSPSPAA